MSMHCRLPAVPIRIMKNWEEFGDRRDQVQSDQQQGLFWRMQLLRTDLPPGADRTDTKSRISAAGGKGSNRILILRDISMMWADRLQICGIHPVKSR